MTSVHAQGKGDLSTLYAKFTREGEKIFHRKEKGEENNQKITGRDSAMRKRRRKGN